jgi:hypothetical protein
MQVSDTKGSRHTRRIAAAAWLLLGATAALMAAAPARAGGVQWSVGIQLPPVVVAVGRGPSYGPPPVVYAPPPVVYAPPPVVYVPPPRVVHAPPAYYQPPARVVYAPPPVHGWGHGGGGHRQWRDRDRDGIHDRHDRWDDRRDDRRGWDDRKGDRRGWDNRRGRDD